MSTVVSIFMPNLSGFLDTPGNSLTMKLTKSSDKSSVNGAGDLLAEVSESGWFICTVEEDWNELVGVTIVNQNGLVPKSGWMRVGANVVSDSLAETASASISLITLESSVGPGSDFVTIEIKDDGVGVAGVSVWITDDPDGVNVIAGTFTTNDLGRVRFLLTDGAEYYLWAKKTGKISINGQQFTAEADA